MEPKNVIEETHNCFACLYTMQGTDKKCPMYATTQSYQERCVYSIVAERDMAKHKSKIPNITLGFMLMQYLEHTKDDRPSN